MTKARVFLSEETIRKISSGEMVTIRVAEVVEIEVAIKPQPVDSKVQKAKDLVDSILGEGKMDAFLDSLFGKKHPQ